MNDVLKEQEPAFLKLTDSAEALLQAMEGLVMILDVQGKVLDSNSSSVTEIHPLHRRWIDSRMGKNVPENLRNQLLQGIQKAITTKTTELIRFSLNDTSQEVSHEYRIVPHSSKTVLCRVREIHDEIKPDERREQFCKKPCALPKPKPGSHHGKCICHEHMRLSCGCALIRHPPLRYIPG